MRATLLDQRARSRLTLVFALCSSPDCEDRELSVYLQQNDEYTNPSGPVYPECNTAGADECCRVLDTKTIAYQDVFIQSPKPGVGRNFAGCVEQCAAAPGGARRSSSGSCLPVESECEQRAAYTDNWSGANVRRFQFYCMCGPRGTSTRQLREADANSTLALPDPTPAVRVRQRALSYSEGIDAFNGGHFDASDQCYAQLVDFKTRFLLSPQVNCGEYFSLTQPPVEVNSDVSPLPVCGSEGTGPGDCCVVDRDKNARSRIFWSNTDQDGSHFEEYTDSVGDSVSSSMGFAVGQITHDDWPDIVMGNQLFVNPGIEKTDPVEAGRRLQSFNRLKSFRHTRPMKIGAEEFKFVSISQVDGEAGMDLVGVLADGTAFVASQDPLVYQAQAGHWAPVNSEYRTALAIPGYVQQSGYCVASIDPEYMERHQVDSASACAAKCATRTPASGHLSYCVGFTYLLAGPAFDFEGTYFDYTPPHRGVFGREYRILHGQYFKTYADANSACEDYLGAGYTLARPETVRQAQALVDLLRRHQTPKAWVFTKKQQDGQYPSGLLPPDPQPTPFECAVVSSELDAIVLPHVCYVKDGAINGLTEVDDFVLSRVWPSAVCEKTATIDQVQNCYTHYDPILVVGKVVQATSVDSAMCYASTNATTNPIYATPPSEVRWRRLDRLHGATAASVAAVAVRSEWNNPCKIRNGCVRVNRDVVTAGANGESLLYSNPSPVGRDTGLAPDFGSVTPVSPLPREEDDATTRRHYLDATVLPTDKMPTDAAAATETVFFTTSAGTRNIVQIPMPDVQVRSFGPPAHANDESNAVAVSQKSGTHRVLVVANGPGSPSRTYFVPLAPGAPEIARIFSYQPPSPPSPPPSPPPPSPFPSPPAPLPPPPSPLPPPPPPPVEVPYWYTIGACAVDEMFEDKRVSYTTCNTMCESIGFHYTDTASTIAVVRDWETAGFYLYYKNKYLFAANGNHGGRGGHTRIDRIHIGASKHGASRLYKWADDLSALPAKWDTRSEQSESVSAAPNLWCDGQGDSTDVLQEDEGRAPNGDDDDAYPGSKVAFRSPNSAGRSGDGTVEYCWAEFRGNEELAATCMCGNVRGNTLCPDDKFEPTFRTPEQQWYLPLAWVPFMKNNLWKITWRQNLLSMPAEDLHDGETSAEQHERARTGSWINTIYEAYKTLPASEFTLPDDTKRGDFFHTDQTTVKKWIGVDGETDRNVYEVVDGLFKEDGVEKGNYPSYLPEGSIWRSTEGPQPCGENTATPCGYDGPTYRGEGSSTTAGRRLFGHDPLDVHEFMKVVDRAQQNGQTPWNDPMEAVHEQAISLYANHTRTPINATRVAWWYARHLGGLPWDFPQQRDAAILGRGVSVLKGAHGPVMGVVRDPPPAPPPLPRATSPPRAPPSPPAAAAPAARLPPPGFQPHRPFNVTAWGTTPSHQWSSLVIAPPAPPPAPPPRLDAPRPPPALRPRRGLSHGNSGGDGAPVIYTNEMPPLPPANTAPGDSDPNARFLPGFVFSNSRMVDGTAIPNYPLGDAEDNSVDAAIGDLNGDGFGDIVLANGRGATKVYYGTTYTEQSADFSQVAAVVISDTNVDTRHVEIVDMDRDGRNDLVAHNVALPGDCAVRCRAKGRFGFNGLTLRGSQDSETHSLCYCGPSIDLMMTPTPPPAPPSPPPSPDPPPPCPPAPSPLAPPPSPPVPLVHTVGMCLLHR